MRQKNKWVHFQKHPTIIVGQWPGNQRVHDWKPYVFHGNRTGDLVEEIIEGKENIVLTNTTNYVNPTQTDVQLGKLELMHLINIMKPNKIICLGNVARDAVYEATAVLGQASVIYWFRHPSFINRFKSSLRQKYIDSIRELL